MSRSFGKDVENAVNSVVEALVRRTFEAHERLRQKEHELIKLHESTINEIEKGILESNKNHNFSLENENGLFTMKSLQNNQLIFENNEKQVSVNLNEIESVVKPMELEKPGKEELPQDIHAPKDITGNQYIKEFEGKSDSEIDGIINDYVEKIDSWHHAAYYEEDSERRSYEYQLVDEAREDLEKMKIAKDYLNSLSIVKDISINKPSGIEKTNSEDEIKKISNDKSIVNIVPIEQAKGINNNFNKNLEINVQNSLDNNKSGLLISSQIRGQMEALNHLKSLSDKEIIKNFKNAEKQARIEGRPTAEVYKENLVKQVNAEVQISKEKTLDVAINSFEKNKEMRENLRGIENEINKNTGVLYQAKIENRIPPEEYNKMKAELDSQKAQINDRLMKIDHNEHKINEQLKVDLKQQFPEMRTDNLKINESVGLATAAYTMTNEKTIENLRNFSLENDLKGVIHSIDKTTKEIEIEITEITEIISR